MLKVLELFAGIGACSKALENLGIEHEIVDAVEIDKYAIKSFNAVHGTNFEPQDITKWDKDIECDLIMHGSPCQDFSVAGKNAGGDKDSGTRSSLMYETLRIVEKLRPKYVIWENVKNLLSKKHRHNFDAYLDAMTDLGYTNNYQVLNAKDYGIPQNRERVFTVSIRDDLKNRMFLFPDKQPLTKKLEDILEQVVDEKFYLTDEQARRMKTTSYERDAYERRVQHDICMALSAREYKDPRCIQVGTLDIKGQDIIKRVYSTQGVSPTLTSMQGGNREPKNVASRGRGEHNMQHLEPRKDDLTNTIPTGDSQGTLDGFRIRKLTPRECWRLMGFDDTDFEKAKNAGISNSQLYKQAGNSIVVNVLEGILKNLIKE